MSNATKDFAGAIVVALISMLLVILLMGSVVLLGQSAGKSIRGQVAETHAGGLDGPEQVPVLCYHYLRGSTGPLRLLKILGYVILSLPLLDDNEIWTLDVASFESQMRYLHENGYRTVSPDELAAWQRGEKDLPQRPVVITFDDGDRSVYELAWPILQKYGLTATFFVVTNRVGEEWEGVSCLSWGELREMYESGVFAIESHTHDLHYRVETGRTHTPVFIAASRGDYKFERYDSWESAILDDLGTSRQLIRRHIGTEPRSIAWPFGGNNVDVDNVAVQAGFTYTMKMQGGTNKMFAPDTPESGQRVINRYGITARTSPSSFRKILRGTYTDPDA